MRKLIMRSASKAFRIIAIAIVFGCISGGPMYSEGVPASATRNDAAPKILSVFPFDGDTNVDPQCHIYANFDSDMTAGSINSFSFTLSDEKSEISGKVFYNREEKKAVFLPDFPLEWGMTYQVRIGKSVKNSLGIASETEKIWLFTVKAGDYIHPSLVSSNPSPDERKVPISKSIILLFSETLNKNSVNNDSVQILEEGQTQVPTRVVFEENSNQIEVIPKIQLNYNTLYTVKVNKYISDLAGNILLKDVTFDYYTRAEPDVIPPKMIRNIPYDGSSFVEVDAVVSALFNEPLNRDNIDAFTVVVKKIVSEESIPGQVSYNSDINEIRFKPIDPLDYNTDYEVTLKPGIIDLHGNAVKELIIWKFKTKTEPDTVAPKIVSYSPRDMESDVSINTSIEIEASENLTPVTVNEFTVKLLDGGIKHSSRIVYDDAKRKIFITPEKELMYNTIYTVKLIGSGIKDLSGNSMAKDVNFQFRTSLPPDRDAPRVTEILPRDGASGIKPSATVEVIVSEEIKPESINGENFKLTVMNRVLKTKLDYYPASLKVEITPLESLPYAKRVMVEIQKLEDKHGNIMMNLQKSYFTVQDPPDRKAPEVTRIVPENNANFVPVDSKIVVEFSEAILPASINDITVKLWDGTRLIATKFGFEKTTNKLFIIPKEKLLYSHDYQVRLGKGIQDMSFNALLKSYVWRFRTISQGPVVVYTNPSENAVNVDVTNNIMIIFDKPLKEDTINSFTVKLFENGNIPVKISNNYDSKTMRLVIIPEGRLKFGKTYDVKLLEGIKDIMNRPLAREHQLHFSTMNKAALAGISVAEGYTYVETDPFKDLSRTHWAFDIVKQLVRKGYLEEYPFEGFQGHKSFSRYQMAMTVNKILQEVEQREKINRFEAIMIEKLVLEFSRELTVIGVKLNEFELRVRRLNIDISSLREEMDDLKTEIVDVKEDLLTKLKNQRSNFFLMMAMMMI